MLSVRLDEMFQSRIKIQSALKHEDVSILDYYDHRARTTNERVGLGHHLPRQIPRQNRVKIPMTSVFVVVFFRLGASIVEGVRIFDFRPKSCDSPEICILRFEGVTFRRMFEKRTIRNRTSKEIGILSPTSFSFPSHGTKECPPIDRMATVCLSSIVFLRSKVSRIVGTTLTLFLKRRKKASVFPLVFLRRYFYCEMQSGLKAIKLSIH